MKTGKITIWLLAFSDLEAAKVFADEIQRGDKEQKYVADFKAYTLGDYDYLYIAKK